MPQDLSKLPLKYALLKDGERVGSIVVTPTENRRVTVGVILGSKTKLCFTFDPSTVSVDEVISTLTVQCMRFGQGFRRREGKTWQEKLHQMGFGVVEVS